MSNTKQQQYVTSADEQNAQSMNNYQPYPQGQQQQQQYVTSAYEQNAQSMNNYQPYPQGQQHTTVIMAAPAAYNGQPIKDHLVWSIFNLCLLCPILGLMAVIFSVLSRSSKSTGQWEDARSHGSVALGLNIAGTVLGVLGWIMVMIYSIVVF